MLTPEQAQDLVKWAGSQHAAGRAIGVHRSTIRGWLYPEENRGNFRRYLAENREAVNSRKRERYAELPGVDYNRLLLRIRRNKALQRRAQREQRRAT